MGKISRASFNELEANGHSVRDNYSGRGMYGKQCFALVGHVDHLLRMFGDAQVLELEDIDLYAMSGNISQDNMGLEFVYYFPNWTVAVDDDESDEMHV